MFLGKLFIKTCVQHIRSLQTSIMIPEINSSSAGSLLFPYKPNGTFM